MPVSPPFSAPHARRQPEYWPTMVSCQGGIGSCSAGQPGARTCAAYSPRASRIGTARAAHAHAHLRPARHRAVPGSPCSSWCSLFFPRLLWPRCGRAGRRGALVAALKSA
ncbi:hypothetical protein PAHAL_2G435600 [Panicum hallii]|uniref:Uncharacterized protein n=1 Tax=Panicum hallii TaxID=206008 RepID=A0A2T8KSM0_9POAL|nr:hypothetical protein PAHAL_2G435600 [Panicum hallii]